MVSSQALRNLSYDDSQISEGITPVGNFTIYIDTSAMPYYSELSGYKANTVKQPVFASTRMSKDPVPEYTPPSTSRNDSISVGGVNTNGTQGWTTSGTDIQGLVDKIGQQAFGAIEQMMNGLTAYGAASSGQYLMRESINWDYLNYYVVTLDRNSPTPNYKQWKKNNVAGVIVEAGYLYNSSHVEVYYRNPKIHEQCIFAEKSKVPFGLYCICKARNLEEAQKEIYQLSFCIRKYPPVLGMWVRFQLTKSISENDKIVDYYLEQMKILGLYGKIGILANMTELKNISWEKKHYKNWVLWLDEHVKDIGQVEKLLEPEMFTIGTSRQLEYAPNGVLVGTGTSEGGGQSGSSIRPTSPYTDNTMNWKGYRIKRQACNPTTGVWNFNGHVETYYSQRVLPGGGLKIPGRHVNKSDGTVRDVDNYIVLARPELISTMRRGDCIMTSLGAGKFYDTNAGSTRVDIYTDW